MTRAAKRDSTARESSCCSKIKIAPAGIQAEIAEALPLVDEVMRRGLGPFGLQAAIASEHARAKIAAETDWHAILHLYDQLELLQPTAVVSLNRAVAVAKVEGEAAALAIVDNSPNKGTSLNTICSTRLAPILRDA